MDAITNPYVGPRTFRENERDRFFGRKREARDLLALVISEQLVLFYAQSGAGKSSLVNTCLIPDLKHKGFQIFTGRVSGDAPSEIQVDNIYIFNLLRSLAPDSITLDSVANMTISEFFSKLRDDSASVVIPKEEQISNPHALIIDQFEEIFSTHHEAWEKRGEFFQQLAETMEVDPYLWVILVMREDFIAALDPYAYLLPSRFRRRYYMQRLERNAALEAIKKPVNDLRPYADGVAEKLVDDLCGIRVYKPDGTLDIQPGQYVEPVQLQVICYNLWENLPSEGTQITEKDLQDVGDVNTSLGNYYAGRVKAVAEAKNVRERRIREWFTDKLISPGGIRNMVLQEPGGKSSGLENDIIQALPDLIRAEQRGGATFYELTHDRLVEPIIENNKKWEEEHYSPLQKQAALWNDQGRDDSWLLTDQALVEVEEWASEHQDEITNIEREFLDACRKLQTRNEERNKLAEEIARSAQRAKRFNAIAVSLAVIALILAGFAVWSARQASAAQVKANNAANAAQTAEADAKDQRAKAFVLKDTARARELASLANTQQLDLSMLLSVEAYNVQPENRDAQSILFENGLRSARLVGFLANSIDPASQFRFSPDGKFLAAIKRDGKQEKLFLWNLDEELQAGRELDSNPVSQFFFSSDSQYLIYLDRDGFTIWDLKNQEVKESLNGHVGEVTQIIFSPDGSYATLGENGNVILWGADTAESDTSAPRGDVIAVSPDGTKLALFAGDEITFINISKNDKQPAPQPIEREPNSVVSLAFSQDGKTLAIADKDNSISFWDLTHNQETNTTFTPGTKIEKMAFNPNGDLIIFNASDGFNILDGNSGKQKVDPVKVSDITFSPDGGLLFSGSGSTAGITLYDTTNAKPINSNSLAGSLVEFSWDSKMLAIFTDADHTVRLVNAQGEKIVDINIQNSPVVSMAFSHDAKLLAIGAEDGSLTIWDVNSKTIKKSVKPYNNPITSLAFSLDGKQLVAGRKDSTIGVWDLNNAKPETRGTDYPGYIRTIDLSPDGKYLYSIANDGIVLLNMGKFDAAGTIPTTSRFPQVQFNAGNTVLAVFEKDKIILWNTESHKQISLDGDFDMSSTNFSPKGDILVTSDKNGKKTLWNAFTGEAFSEIAIPEFSNVVISPNDRFVIAWDTKTNLINLFQEISTGAISDKLNGLTLSLSNYFPTDFSKIFSPSGNIVVTSSPNNQLNLWNLSTGEPESLGDPIDANQVFAFNHAETIMMTFSNSNYTYTLWDLKTLEKIEQSVPIQSTPQVSPDGETLAVLSYGNLYVLDFGTGKVIGNRSALYGDNLTFDPDGNFLVIASSYNLNPSVTLWDLTKIEQLGETINQLYVGLDGKLLITKTATGDAISIFDATSGKQIGMPIQGASGNIGNVTFDPNGDVRSVRHEGNTKEESTIELLRGNKPFSQDSHDTVVISPDQTHFVIFGPDGGLTLWNVSTSTLPKNTIKEFNDPITGESLSSDGKTLAVSSENSIALWDLTHDPDKLIGELSNRHIKEATDAYLSPKNKILVINNGDGELSIWNPDKGSKVIEPIHEVFCGFSPNGKILVTTPSGNTSYYSSITSYTFLYSCYSNTSGYTYNLWDTSTGKPIGDHLSGDSPSTNSYSFSENSLYLMVHSSGASDFKVMKIMYGVQGINLVKLGDPIPGTFQSFVADGQFVISSDGGNFNLWKTDPGTEKRTAVSTLSINKTNGYISQWLIAPNGKSALLIWYDYSSSKQTFYLWDIRAAHSGTAPLQNLTNYTFSADYKLFAGLSDRGALIWDLTTGKETPIQGTPVSFSPDNQYLAVVENLDETNLINILSTSTGKKLNAQPFSGSFWGFSGSNSEVVLLYKEKEGGYMRYSTQSGDEIGSIIRANGFVFSPDKQTFAAYYYQGGGSLWRTTATDKISDLETQSEIIGFSADSKTLITKSTNQNITEISLWATDSGKKRISSMEYPGFSTGLRLNPDQNLLAIFGNEGIYIWDLTHPDDKPLFFSNLTGKVSRMMFSPDNETLATIGNDGVFLWDVSKQTARSELLRGNTGHIADIAFTKDSKTLVYLDTDGSVWKVAITDHVQPPAEPFKKLETACRMALSGDGKYLVYKSGKKLYLSNLTASTIDYTLNIRENISVSCSGPIAFSEDGTSLAYSEHAGNYDRISVYTLDENGAVSKPTELRTDNIKSSSINALTFVLDKKILAATATDGRISFWDTDTRNLLGIFDQPGWVKRFANGKLEIYFPAERRLIQMHFENEAWKGLLKKWQADLCLKVGRHLAPDEWDTYFPGLIYPANPACPMPTSVPSQS